MGLNILIVDDSSVMRSMLKKTLEMCEVSILSIHEANNGAEGLRVLDKEWIDLVLVDINMPVMNGMEMIDAMREDPDSKDVPVVVVSTETSDTRIQEILSKGMKFIHKPFTPEKVEEILHELLGTV